MKSKLDTLEPQLRAYAQAQREDYLRLTKALVSIPAPTGQEGKKAAFVQRWLTENGCAGALLDQAGNVLWPYHCEGSGPIVLFTAHLDVVFEDKLPVPVRQEDDRCYAPGIHDDSSNLAALLLCARYLARFQPETRCGLLLAANVCEEGLGNLRGSRQLCQDWGSRVQEMLSLDGNFDRIVNRAVGSCRYRVQTRTKGGHSYNAFGNPNAVYQLCDVIQALRQIPLPTWAKTTCNVGLIQGGTSVNTIPQEASMLYEFRSEDDGCLEEMKRAFDRVIAGFQVQGMEVTAELLGVRPCGRDVDPAKQAALTARCREVIERFTDRPVQETAGSTDANTFLFHGIPAVTIGAAIGGETHTRQEWLELSSLTEGLMIALGSVLQYAQG